MEGLTVEFSTTSDSSATACCDNITTYTYPISYHYPWFVDSPKTEDEKYGRAVKVVEALLACGVIPANTQAKRLIEIVSKVKEAL